MRHKPTFEFIVDADEKRNKAQKHEEKLLDRVFAYKYYPLKLLQAFLRNSWRKETSI
jgi:hypothetical protein